MPDIRDLPAIDIHAHYGVWEQNPEDWLMAQCMSADAATVAERARAANVEWTVVSPLSGLMPRGRADAAIGNDEAAEVIDRTPGLLQWVIVNPLQPRTYDQARERLQHPRCAGIKIHPEEHCYPISEHAAKIFAFAAEYDAVVLTHSGEANSLPADFVAAADAHPNVKLILAHIGCSQSRDLELQVRAAQAARHGNVFADTSSIRSMCASLIEWAVAELGPERVLFGTDSPLYFTAAQRARIDSADLPEAQKRMILRENAERLLTLPPR